jgi:hypothetical protein
MDLYNRARIDRAALREYAREFGGKIVGERVDEVLGFADESDGRGLRRRPAR